jgi:hypothetical protein
MIVVALHRVRISFFLTSEWRKQKNEVKSVLTLRPLKLGPSGRDGARACGSELYCFHLTAVIQFVASFLKPIRSERLAETTGCACATWLANRNDENYHIQIRTFFAHVHGEEGSTREERGYAKA